MKKSKKKAAPKKTKAAKKSFRFLWITDPWDTLDHANDTTIRLAREAIAQGHESYWSDVRTLRWQDQNVLADIRRIQAIPQNPSEENITFAENSLSPVAEFNQVHYRVDPPVDLTYLHYLQLLRIAEHRGAKI